MHDTAYNPHQHHAKWQHNRVFNYNLKVGQCKHYLNSLEILQVHVRCAVYNGASALRALLMDQWVSTLAARECRNPVGANGSISPGFWVE